MIDSQAARREHMPQAPPHRPPRRRGGRRRRPLLEEPPVRPLSEAPEPDATKIASGATVSEVAETLSLGSAEVIKKLMELGEMATLTQTLPDEAVMALAAALDQKVEIVSAAEEEPEEPVYEDAEEDLADRPPVVTIMGHVDHGKTSLLDAIRETEVVAGEAGGITQHIGAYQVHQNGKRITFLDTPGHEAFTAMRARGAKVTDLAVIVVAADDGVMPQTVEAIDHARAADVPILIAVNKIDKHDAEPDRVRNELASQGLNPEDWGGETIFFDVSAKTKEGLDNLLEMIVLVAELEELKANPNAPASGVVIESHLDPGRGPVATVLVQRGTLQVGDALVAGATWGKVRAMLDFTGARVEGGAPGRPGRGARPRRRLRGRRAGRGGRRTSGARGSSRRSAATASRPSRSPASRPAGSPSRRSSRRRTEGELKELNIVLKADVSGLARGAPGRDRQGPAGADRGQRDPRRAGRDQRVRRDARRGLRRDHHRLQRPPAGRGAPRRRARGRRDPHLLGDLQGHRGAPRGDGGHARARGGRGGARPGRGQGAVPGLARRHDRRLPVTDGKVTRTAQVRLVREGTVVWTGRLGSLRRFKDNVQEVEEGLECGVVLEGYQDVKVGDVLEFFETKQVEQTLE